MAFFTTALATFFLCWLVVPALCGLARLFGLYTTVREQESKVYIMFGKVVAVLQEPGLHFPLTFLGPQAFFIHFFGSVQSVDMRLDQVYLRSQPVNSEEGTPMGIGVWYEMSVSDPVDFLFKNTDPRGSLQANVANATVRCLSNMPLETLLEDRHQMSRVVRAEVSPKSEAWGYRLGSVYIRKVHFRDQKMTRQIEQKVVNRLRQVTSAIVQAGANQVAIVRSRAEKEAASEFARAAAMRPYLVGQALQEISTDPDILAAMFEILEIKNMLEGEVDLTLVPEGIRSDILSQLLAAQSVPPSAAAHPYPAELPPPIPQDPFYHHPPGQHFPGA